MNRNADRYELASDNTAGICPEALAALQGANIGAAPSYGDDRWTARVCDLVREIFETDCDVYLVFNGTAANALALAQLCQPFHSVICHEHAHIQTDECGAPEFFTGGSKLLLVGGAHGSRQRVRPVADKIDIGEAEAIIARQPELHAHNRASSASRNQLSSEQFTRAMKSPRSLNLRDAGRCLCTWMGRALQMRSRLSIARRTKSRGKSALMFSVSAERRMASLPVSWSSFSKKN